MQKETLTTFTSAPLPFMGQKRRFIKEFKEALKTFDSKTIFVDLFGGSGLLSHITKRERPDARVIYNDYDDYHIRLQNIDKTNRLLADLRKLVVSIPKNINYPHKFGKRFYHELNKKKKTDMWII